MLQAISFHPKAAKGQKGSIGAPMPGEIIDVKVKEGDKVVKGQLLVVISAMKMEMSVAASVGGVVKKVLVEKGQKMQGDDLLVEIEESK